MRAAGAHRLVQGGPAHVWYQSALGGSTEHNLGAQLLQPANCAGWSCGWNRGSCMGARHVSPLAFSWHTRIGAWHVALLLKTCIQDIMSSLRLQRRCRMHPAYACRVFCMAADRWRRLKPILRHAPAVCKEAPPPRHTTAKVHLLG